MTVTTLPGDSLDLQTLQTAYAAGITPVAVLRRVLQRIDAAGDDHVWITRRPDADILRDAAALGEDRRHLPLFGVPFAVKDCIDAAGLPTTAACPDFAYVPAQSATVVDRLIAAGAVLVGKTNMDQFATGLVGTRSPYGVPRNPFDAAFVPGGSSSGSAVAVASGLVSFALGSDTAGSGRVPAAFNNLVGIKPTRGLLSNRGTVPACRSIDCLSVFALTVDDAADVMAVVAGFDPGDPMSRAAPPGFSPRPVPPPARFRFGVPQPAQLRFFGDAEAARLFDEAVARMERLGGTAVPIDFAPWTECAALLYGPFVAERTAALTDRLRDRPDTLHPVTRGILTQGLGVSGVDLYLAQSQLAVLAQAIRPVWDAIDLLLVPTTGTAWRIADVDADPVGRNSDLGIYTNFTNLLDLAAVAVPGGFKMGDFEAGGFPAGVTLIGPAWHDGVLAGYARAMQQAAGLSLGATGVALPPGRADGPSAFPRVDIAVFGAHLDGQPLNPALRALGGRFVRACRTTASYRMVALPGAIARPGLLPGSHAIKGEVWSLPSATVGAFLATIGPPLGLGTVQLDDGPCAGFICEADGGDAPDISAFGGWRAYRAS